MKPITSVAMLSEKKKFRQDLRPGKPCVSLHVGKPISLQKEGMPGSVVEMYKVKLKGLRIDSFCCLTRRGKTGIIAKIRNAFIICLSLWLHLLPFALLETIFRWNIIENSLERCVQIFSVFVCQSLTEDSSYSLSVKMASHCCNRSYCTSARVRLKHSSWTIVLGHFVGVNTDQSRSHFKDLLALYILRGKRWSSMKCRFVEGPYRFPSI